MPFHARTHPRAKGKAGWPAISTMASSHQALGNSFKKLLGALLFQACREKGDISFLTISRLCFLEATSAVLELLPSCAVFSQVLVLEPELPDYLKISLKNLPPKHFLSQSMPEL